MSPNDLSKINIFITTFNPKCFVINGCRNGENQFVSKSCAGFNDNGCFLIILKIHFMKFYEIKYFNQIKKKKIF